MNPFASLYKDNSTLNGTRIPHDNAELAPVLLTGPGYSISCRNENPGTEIAPVYGRGYFSFRLWKLPELGENGTL